jgi:hypothetical protein
MNIYHFHPTTGVYLGQGGADTDPLDTGNWLYPANSTLTPPPTVGGGFVTKFENGAWQTAALPAPEPVPVPPTPAEIKVANLKKIDANVDLLYALAIGNRATEYSEAEVQATSYKNTGYSGTTPPYVASWLSYNTKGLTTAQQAADDILTQASTWRSASSAIRSNRLAAKKNLANDVPTAMAQWEGFVTAIRGQLGL